MEASSESDVDDKEMKIKEEPVEAVVASSSAHDDESVTLDVLKSFSKKEKKLLLKRLIHLERKRSSK